MIVVMDERLLMKCETLKEQRKISLHESHISRLRKCLCPFSGWQEFAAKFDTVSCSLLPAANFNLGHYSHGESCLKSLWVQLINCLLPARISEACRWPNIFTTTLLYIWAMSLMLVYREGCDLTWSGELCTRGWTIWIHIRVIKQHHANALMQECWHELTYKVVYNFFFSRQTDIWPIQ